MPLELPFQWTVRVYYEDTDLGGVVYYANYLKYLERARTEWLRALGIENRAQLAQENAIFVVTECQIKYLSAAQMDDQLVVSIDKVESRRVSAVMEQNIHCTRANGVTTKIATAQIRFAYVGADDLKPRLLPAAITLSSGIKDQSNRS